MFDAEFDELIDQYASEMNPEVRNQVAYRIQEKLYNEVPLIALYLQLDVYGVNERLDWTARKDEYVLGKDITIR
jgi:ABC-type transport system substrate-binding protein